MRKNCSSLQPRIFKLFGITRTIYSISERSQQFLKQNTLLTDFWRFLRTNILNQFEFKLEKNWLGSMQQELKKYFFLHFLLYWYSSICFFIKELKLTLFVYHLSHRIIDLNPDVMVFGSLMKICLSDSSASSFLLKNSVLKNSTAAS